MYYVYEWFIVETGEIIYVGKGTRKRYTVTKHNRFFNDMIKRFHCESRIVKYFEDEEDAFDYEYQRINELKAVGQCVCNIYQGGTGGTTKWWTDDLKEQYSQKNVMKSKEQRKRMSENNPMKNKNVAKRVASKKSRAVIIGDKEFASVKEARETLGCATDTIRKWCINGVNSKGEICRYKDNQIKTYKPRNSHGNQQPSRGNTDKRTPEGSTTNG